MQIIEQQALGGSSEKSWMIFFEHLSGQDIHFDFILGKFESFAFLTQPIFSAEHLAFPSMSYIDIFEIITVLKDSFLS